MSKKHFRKSWGWLLVVLCVLADTGAAYAQTISEGQAALKRGQLKFYEAAKANPKATAQELAKIRDTTQREGALTWAQAVTGAIQKLFTKTGAAPKSATGAASPAAEPGQSAPKVQPKKSGFSSSPAEPGIDGSQVPGMLEFPGAKKP